MDTTCDHKESTTPRAGEGLLAGAARLGRAALQNRIAPNESGVNFGTECAVLPLVPPGTGDHSKERVSRARRDLGKFLALLALST